MRCRSAKSASHRGYPAAKPAEFDSQTASDAGALHFAIGGQAMEEIMVI